MPVTPGTDSVLRSRGSACGHVDKAQLCAEACAGAGAKGPCRLPHRPAVLSGR